jgi:hypothetical protein
MCSRIAPSYVAPGYGVGYVQSGGQVSEIESVTMSADVRPDRLVDRASVSVGPDEVSMEITPVAWGPILLKAPDGRIADFPRAMCHLTTEDGRTGTGWIEWNRVRREAADQPNVHT